MKRLVVFAALAVLHGCSQSVPSNAINQNRRTAPAYRISEQSRDLARFVRRDGTPFSAAAPKAVGRQYDVASYHLQGKVDWNAVRLIATVTIRLKLDDAALDHVDLDSWVTSISRVTLNGSHSPSYTLDTNKGVLAIDLSGMTAAERAQELVLDVAYEAVASDQDHASNGLGDHALRAILPRLGDPIAVRTINTMSEPQSASEWMPCNDDPADRAQFSSEFDLPVQETFIANGALTLDRTNANGTRTMGYATAYSIPTYLMAFAQSEFVKAETRIANGLPVAIYARRGLPIDMQGILDHTSSIITNYERLLGKFPFEKYAIVFLPEFGGGEEHAGITFQTEMWGTDPQGSGDLGMIAHEMGHQWFGDYMTVEHWDDLWIKEGMATLLAAESDRPYADTNHRHILFGSHMEVVEGEAVYDPTVPPNEKYNSGPYGHSAWVLTQLRSLLGDDSFFALMRQILADHAYGNISTEQFIGAIEFNAGPEIATHIRKAIVAKKVPKIHVDEAQIASGEAFSLTLQDDDKAMFVPIGVQQFTKTGISLNAFVSTQLPLTVASSDQRALIVLDPLDVHPWSQFVIDGSLGQAALDKSFVPSAEFAVNDFLQLPASAQETSLSSATTWLRSPEEFSTLAKNAASEAAKAYALSMACRQAAPASDATMRASWAVALTPVFLNPPLLGTASWYDDPKLAACGSAPGVEVLASDYQRLISAPGAADYSPAYVSFLGAFSQTHQFALKTIGNVVLNGRSVRHRAAAARILGRYVTGAEDHPAMTDGDRLAWKLFYRKILTQTIAAEVLRYALAATVALDDAEAWEALAILTANSDFVPMQKKAVCTAAKVTQTRPELFQAFVERVEGIANLHPAVVHLLQDRAGCGR